MDSRQPAGSSGQREDCGLKKTEKRDFTVGAAFNRDLAI
jgi:hypothetical protein